MTSVSDPSPIARADWEEFRRRMPVAQRWAYLDHAAVAPLSGASRDALVGWSEQAAVDGDTAWPTWSNRCWKSIWTKPI